MKSGLVDHNFIKIIERTIGTKRLLNAFYLEPCTSNGFAWFYENNTFYIIELETGILISWEGYKLKNNKCSYKITVDDYYRLFNNFDKALRKLRHGDENER